MVITIGNQKGGVGKTTIATNLACLFARDRHVLLIDADTQQSSADFHATRLENESLPQFTCVAITKQTIHKDIKNFSNFDIVIIDVGGRDNAVFRSAILASDYLIVPITPSQYDIWATEDTFQIIDEAKTIKDMKVYIVLNQVIPNTKIVREVHEALMEKAEQYDLNIFKSILSSRVAFKEAISFGVSVAEKDEKSKASAELLNLYNDIKQLLYLQTNHREMQI